MLAAAYLAVTATSSPKAHPAWSPSVQPYVACQQRVSAALTPPSAPPPPGDPGTGRQAPAGAATILEYLLLPRTALRLTDDSPRKERPLDRHVTVGDYPPSAVPWPDAVGWSRAELRAYLAAAANPGIQVLPTRCPPWTVADLTAHLAATFQRFAGQLAKARDGTLDAPFPPGQLSSENLRAVQDFCGDPRRELAHHAGRFLGSVNAAGEQIGHQHGPIPVGLQVMFGLTELTVHHDDLAHATGSSYRPADDIAAALADMHSAVFGMPAGPDRWACLLQACGR